MLHACTTAANVTALKGANFCLRESAQVIAELRGSEKRDEIMVAGHSDSGKWARDAGHGGGAYRVGAVRC